MVGWLLKQKHDVHVYQINWPGNETLLNVLPKNLWVDQGHESNGVAGYGFFLGLFSMLTAWRMRNAQRRLKSLTVLTVLLFLAVLFTLSAFIFTFVVTYQTTGQQIREPVAVNTAGMNYPEFHWTPETWFKAVLDLPLADQSCKPRRITITAITKNCGPAQPTLLQPAVSSRSTTPVFAMSWLFYLAMPPVLIMAMRLLSLVLPAKPAQLLSFYAFAISSFILMGICALYGTLVALPLRMVGYGGLIQWTVARSFKWCMWFGTGVTFRVTGSMKKEAGVSGEDALRDRPAVFVGNHQTELDVLMLGCMFPKYTSVTAKKSLKYTPLLGWFMALSKTVFIDRANRTTARAAFDTAAQTMKSTRQSVFIFPEGTRSYSEKPDLLPFKKGAFHLAVQAQVPIVPVVCANYSHVLNVKAKKFSPGIVDVTVLPPIQTKGLGAEHVDELVKKTRDAMMEELIRLSHISGTGNGEPLPRSSGVDEQARGELRKRY
ncbi:1-acylglycerol-3-phosphate acyltransferase [Curvularia clavata]|uniref:1-acyl-sn-glycerol-3-phosphate acyltransferase n=1 Tax=Curvularia clavata TaxID=95742 RepID=A0A9Q8Z8P9_CURCL|nr:1-acylglycerol-3-phosphate acyltransferase [Curvularia clavata]